MGTVDTIRKGWPYFEGYPFPERFVQLEGLQIHYVDEGYGGRPVLMVHGNPAWSYIWRRLIPPISIGHRAIALDLMGFGESDKPDPTLHDFPHHARIVSGFIESLGLRNIVLIVHDWGGPFAMHYAARHPDNIAGIILMNTFLTTDFRIPPSVASTITPATIKDASIHPDKISEATMAAYWAPFQDEESKRVYKSFAGMFPNSLTHPSYKPMKEVEQSLSTLKVPATLVWGTARSGTVYPDKLSKMIPNSKLCSVKAGHFVQEDEPEEVEKIVLKFLDDNKL